MDVRFDVPEPNRDGRGPGGGDQPDEARPESPIAAFEHGPSDGSDTKDGLPRVVGPVEVGGGAVLDGAQCGSLGSGGGAVSPPGRTPTIEVKSRRGQY